MCLSEEIIELVGKPHHNTEYTKSIDDPLDVIIPVFNAYEDVLNCIKSVLVHQDGYRIIIVNDQSTDERTIKLMMDLKKSESPNLVVLENEENQGFVRTVNKGMRYSHSDVILLNSDTVVTKGWARKLRKCAYSDENIATVTPFTNYMSICAVPRFGEHNEIPQGFTLETFALFIEDISLPQYPEIPIAVGFCVFIKRSVIEEIGYFDEVTFGRGYGEVNDFCMRALRKGHKHILCDDTFVQHSGGKSFLAEKGKLREEDIKILNERYPEYPVLVQRFFESNPLKPLYENITTKMNTWLSIPNQDCGYYQTISEIHRIVKPVNYIEIGVRHGDSLKLASAGTLCVGIDPYMDIKNPINENSRLFFTSSDDFFTRYDLMEILNNQTVDLAFIDGMHLFEYALRDFINLEKCSSKKSFVLVHDSIPIDRLSSERDRKTKVWTGDVWKLIPCLKKHRPDLKIYNLKVPPSGLAIITNLNPKSTTLEKKLDKLYKEYIPLDFTYFEKHKKELMSDDHLVLEDIFNPKSADGASVFERILNYMK